MHSHFTRFSSFIILIFLSLHSFAQSFELREMLDPGLEPFYHGVASGDPLPNAVIIWTRVTAEEPIVSVSWRVSTDVNMSNIIASGSFVTNASRDYTVKVDVTGLQPYTWYYYEFEALGKKSIIGRTKTAPLGSVDQLRFATVSCSNWQSGYFNAYDRIRDRNDIDAVLHLGDYIYEYGNRQYGTLRDRVPAPESEILTLADYRMRHSSYRLDTMLMRLHQQYPFITVWDDHESADNAFRDGASNHSPGEGNWQDRKSYSQQAYDEWIPIRTQSPDKIWRSFSYGDLADIIFLDTRLYDRDEQNSALATNADHKLIGPEQMAWLKEQLGNSTAKWKIIAQQVMFGPALSLKTGNNYLVLNSDQWDGYQAERNEIVEFIKTNNINNVVVLTGDIHTAWAMDLPFGQSQYNPATGSGSVAVEFVTTSVTSPGIPFGGGLQNLIKLINPFLKFADIIKHGYSILDLTPEAAQNDFYYITRLVRPDTGHRWQTAWKTLDGQNRLVRGKRAFDLRPGQEMAPLYPSNVVERKSALNQSIQVLGAYPNPFINYIGLQYYMNEKGPVHITISDMMGKEVYRKEMGVKEKGLQFDFLEGLQMPNGTYNISLIGSKGLVTRNVIKM